MVKKSSVHKGTSPSRLIDARIRELNDWRGKMLSRLRTMITQADPGVAEEWKWRGVPVWSHDGILCTGETYTSVVKLTFFRGAALEDPSGLFNSSLDGNVRRAIDIHEGEKIDVKALKALIRAAVVLNASHTPGNQSGKINEDDLCLVVKGTHTGKKGIVRDVKRSKTGAITITVVQASGERFKTLAKNVTVAGRK